MSDDLESRGHHAITHDGESYIKLADASVTFSLYRKDIAAKDAEITRLRALCERQSTALNLSSMRHGRILVGLERRNRRQRRALAKLYQRRHDKNVALATLEERERAIELRFWQTVDRDGLTGLPSDMWAALEQLVQGRAAIRAAAKKGEP